MSVCFFFVGGGEKYNNKQGDAGAEEVGIVELVFDICRVYTMS